MPAAVIAIGAVVGGIASAVGAVIAPVVAAVGAVLSPAVAAVGSVIGAVATTLGAALAPVFTTIGGIAEWVITSVGQSVGGLVKTVGDTAGPLLKGIGDAIGGLAKGISGAAEPILSPIKDGLQFVFDKVKAVEDWVNTAFHPSAELAELKSANPEIWAVSDGSNEVFRDLLVSRGVISSTKGALLLLPDAIETINQVATLKVLSDLVQGQASVAELLGAVADGKSFETAVAIAQLSKGIVTSSVGIMDRVDTEVGILRAGIDSFDERLSSELTRYASQTKAEVLAMITPKLDVLGDHQLAVNKKLAQLERHISDEAWFAWMFLRMVT